MKNKIIEKLPASWKEINLKTAIKYLNVEFESAVEDEIENLQRQLNNIYKTISVLTDIPIEEIKNLPKNIIDEAAIKTAFMNQKPKPKKTSIIEWKCIEEITYDNFITYTQLQNDLIDNMPTIIKSFSKNKMNEEEIMNLDMEEIYTAFFLLMKQLKKSVAHMKVSLIRKIMKQKLSNKIHFRKK